MFALNVLINLAKIMLIFNGLNGNSIGISEASFTTISLDVNSNSTSSSSISSISSSEVALEGLSGLDNLNIRHERSKQRRHSSSPSSSSSTSNTEKEQSHVSRNLYEATSDVQQQLQLHMQHQIKNDFKANNVDTTSKRQLFNEFPKSFSLTNAHVSEGSSSSGIEEEPDANIQRINGALVSFTATDVIKNDTSLANKGNKANVFPSTVATLHRLTPSGAMPTTTLKTVTHKIRKLHKKKIVESLRQLNIDKFNINGGHHRSLLEAEQLQQQAIHMARATYGYITATTATPHTTISSSTTENGKQENVRKFEQQEELQWQWLTQTTTTVAAPMPIYPQPPEMQTERLTNVDKADDVLVATNDVDTNESVNDSDLPDMLPVDDDENDVDIDADDDTDEPSDNDDLTDVLYPNDENLLADEGVDANAGNDELLVTTLNPLLDEKYIEKHFKNYSSQFIKEIDNNVDDMEDNETDNPNQQQQQVKDFAHKNSVHNLTGIMDAFNTTYEASNTASPFVTFATEYSNEFHSFEPSLAASTSQHNINLQSSFYDKEEEEEINFNDPSDLTQDDAEDTGDNNHANGFPLTDNDNDADAETDPDAEVILEIGAAGEDDETNHFLEGVVDAANSEEIYDWDEISRSNRRDLMHGRDVVTKFLQIVETQHSLGSNCEAGTSLNLGEGVVDRYAQDRFRVEAEVAVNRANMLTRIFKMTSSAAQADVNLLHASVLSMVEFDDDIFAAGNCFDWNEHPSQPGLFCPFAYRLPPPNLGAILAKDLAMEYHYLGNTSEWFFQARKNAEKVIARNEQYLKAFHLYSNKTDERIEDDTLAVKYEDGRWSKPYYDCGGGNIWMLTYTVPFFGYENTTYHFKGTSGIDIDLRRVDIDQCPQRHIPGSTKPLNIFAGTDKCKQRTTMCEAIQGLGFRRGSYKCVCRKGYYFPDTTSQHKYFNGSLLEEEYEKLMLGKNSTYNIVNEYECLPCAEGCDYCEDGSPCIAALNWPMRTSILALACIVIGLLPPAAWFTFRYQQVKVVRAASPALLRVIALGAFFIYCTNIVMYPNPNLYTCTARIWLREIGFSLTYGALMLKTWRISVIFRVRSAKAVKITDAALLKRLGCICGCIGTCLLVRTLVSPPDVVVGRTADDLKAFLCKTDWWDYTFTSMEVVFLAWGVRLCIMVRKAPSEFNESRFISMAIYNEFLLTCFLNVSMLFLQSPANPDLLYIIFFCHTQLTITLLLALIFGSKVYIVLRSGKSHQENIGMGAKSSGAKFNFRPQVRTFANPSSVTTSTVPVAVTTSAENKLSDQEALEEIRQLSVQLQRIQEMAPPKGVAVMTISSLLDGLKTPGSMVMVAAAATAGGQSFALGGGNQLTVRSQKPEALPLLSLNSEMQKYQQMQATQKTSSAAATTTTNNNVAAMKTMPAITMPSTQVTVTASTPTQAVASKLIAAKGQEMAVNTDIIGNYRGNEEQQHIICQSCYEKCRDQKHYQQLPLAMATVTAVTKSTSSTSTAHSPAKLNKCQMLGSPQQEGSLSFKHIKLDCMCSQSDDLDQLTEQGHQQHQHQHQTSTRRVTKRTAATNTPPCTARKRTDYASGYGKDVKAQSTISLPSGASTSELASRTTATAKVISHVSQQKIKFQKQQQQQQICDNCKNKFKRKTSLEGSDGPREKMTKKSQQQHRKLSRLSSKCNQLLEDIEKSKSKPIATTTATTTTATIALNRAEAATSSKGRTKDCDEDIQYSTDDIIFYTTTDSSGDDDDDNDDDDDISDDDDNTDDSDKSDYEAELAKVLKDDDLSSSLSQSKSETRVPLKLKPQTATIELKCISLSLGNITTTSSVTLTTATTTTITTTEPSSTSSTSQPAEALRNKNALFEPNVIQLSASSPTAVTAASSTSQTATQLGQSQPPASSNGNNGSGSGTGNGKAKRPDKLVLNLNDRSKFTKEVSV